MAAIHAACPKPRLIVIDPLARNFSPGHENDQGDMNKFVQGCDPLVAAFPGATVLVVHHPGKDRRRGARGSLVLTSGRIKTCQIQPKECNKVVDRGHVGRGKDCLVACLTRKLLVTEQGSMSMDYILSEPVELLASDLDAVSGGALTVGSFNLNGSFNSNSNGNSNTAGLLGINGNLNGDLNGNILAIDIQIPVSVVL